jgi:hypothetical protein
MREIIVAAALALALAAPPAVAATCANTGNRAGCVGPTNGAGVYHKNTGTVHKTQPNGHSRVAPATHVQGARGNKATKAHPSN